MQRIRYCISVLIKPIITLLFCQFFYPFVTSGQTSHKSKFIVDESMKDTFAFTRQWAYNIDIWKDESGFHTITSEKITPADTVHLFFTANCKTDTLADYAVKYCYPSKKAGTIKLRFSDYLPAYYIDHSVYIKGDSFYIKLRISYETFTPGEKMVYLVESQQLTLNKKRYSLGDTIIGDIDCRFVEVWTMPGRKTRGTKLYFKGYFCTPFKKEEDKRRW